jgi:hypothetical protein
VQRFVTAGHPIAIWLALVGCAGTQAPEIENRMPDGSFCVTLKVSLICTDSTIEGQCSVTVQNRSGETAMVHSAFAVGDEHEASKWRNLYFRVIDIKGYAWRMNARFTPAEEVGAAVAPLESLKSKTVTYDVALLHHRISRTGNPIPLSFGDYTISAHYDVSRIVTPRRQPFCKQVFSSNKVRVEILGPGGVLSPGRHNPFDRSPPGGHPIDSM